MGNKIEYETVKGYTPNNNYLVLISGQKGSGKTYLANELKSRVMREREVSWMETSIMSLAKCIKDFAWFDKSVPKEKIRPLLQRIGDVCREYDKDFFVNKLWLKIYKEYKNNINHNTYIIVDDIRYQNELDILNKLAKDNGIKVLNFRFRKKNNNPEHPSENLDLDYSGINFIWKEPWVEESGNEQ